MSQCIDSAAHALTGLTRSVGALFVVVSALQACAKDEAPPPLPAPQPIASATAPFTLTPEDAGLDAGMKKEMPKATGQKASGETLDKCCAALKQNAESAPEPNKTYMLQAAAQCSALAASGQGKDGALAILQRVLRGANLPVGCR